MWCNFHKTKLIQYDLASISQSLSTEHARPCNRQSCNSGVRVRMLPASPLPLDFLAAYRWRGGKGSSQQKKLDVIMYHLIEPWLILVWLQGRRKRSPYGRLRACAKPCVRPCPDPNPGAAMARRTEIRLLFLTQITARRIVSFFFRSSSYRRTCATILGVDDHVVRQHV